VLLDLGKLWASRNYAQTGDYYRLALDLARTLEQPEALAHSLNHAGNWHLNVEKPLDALRYHQQALAIFHAQHDQHGLAQTFDLLGTANYIGGNPVQAVYEPGRSSGIGLEPDNAVRMWSELHD
jgi:hypothetical protein